MTRSVLAIVAMTALVAALLVLAWSSVDAPEPAIESEVAPERFPTWTATFGPGQCQSLYLVPGTYHMRVQATGATGAVTREQSFVLRTEPLTLHVQ